MRLIRRRSARHPRPRGCLGLVWSAAAAAVIGGTLMIETAGGHGRSRVPLATAEAITLAYDGLARLPPRRGNRRRGARARARGRRSPSRRTGGRTYVVHPAHRSSQPSRRPAGARRGRPLRRSSSAIPALPRLGSRRPAVASIRGAPRMQPGTPGPLRSLAGGIEAGRRAPARSPIRLSRAARSRCSCSRLASPSGARSCRPGTPDAVERRRRPPGAPASYAGSRSARTSAETGELRLTRNPRFRSRSARPLARTGFAGHDRSSARNDHVPATASAAVERGGRRPRRSLDNERRPVPRGSRLRGHPHALSRAGSRRARSSGSYYVFLNVREPPFDDAARAPRRQPSRPIARAWSRSPAAPRPSEPACRDRCRRASRAPGPPQCPVSPPHPDRGRHLDRARHRDRAPARSPRPGTRGTAGDGLERARHKLRYGRYFERTAAAARLSGAPAARPQGRL